MKKKASSKENCFKFFRLASYFLFFNLCLFRTLFLSLVLEYSEKSFCLSVDFWSLFVTDDNVSYSHQASLQREVNFYFRLIAILTQPIHSYLSDSDIEYRVLHNNIDDDEDDAAAPFLVEDCKLWQVNCINVQSFCFFPSIISGHSHVSVCVCRIEPLHETAFSTITLTHSVIVLNDRHLFEYKKNEACSEQNCRISQ